MTVRRLSGQLPYAGQTTSPGAMCHQVSFYTKGTRNANGTYAARVLFATSWGAFRTLSGRELDQARTITQSVQVLITVPYLAGLQEAMSIEVDDGGDIYQIDYLSDPDGRQIEQRIYCSLINQNTDN